MRITYGRTKGGKSSWERIKMKKTKIKNTMLSEMFENPIDNCMDRCKFGIPNIQTTV